jgi:hypothetical protein
MRALRISTSFMSALGILCACCSALGPCAKAQSSSTAEDVIRTDVCEIAASPDKFDGKVVRIDAYFSREFEDSTLHDPSCPEEALVNESDNDVTEPRIWAEFADDVAYERVKGFAPLVADAQVQGLHALLTQRGHMHQMTRATMIGTFYSGKSEVINGRITPMRGFGQLGCCSLFVISRVESFTVEYANQLDYTWADWNIDLPEGCNSDQMVGVPTNATIRSWQENANQGRDESHRDPLQAAQDELTKIRSGEFGPAGGKAELLRRKKSDLSPPVKATSTATLIETSATSYLKRYEFVDSDRSTRIVILVARPYWLATVAGSPENVIWAPVGASVMNCDASSHAKH